MIHEHLPIGVHPRTDADRRNPDRFGHRLRNPNRHPFKHDREAAGVLKRLRRLHQLASLLGLLSLHLETTHCVDGLRSEANVSHDRDLGVDDLLDHRKPFTAALKLHRVRASPHQLSGIAHGFLRRHVIAHPRQVTHDVAVGLGPSDRRRVMGHIVDRDLQRVVVAQHDHGERVTDQDEVGASLACDSSARSVIRGDHDERIATVTHLARRNCRGRHAHDSLL